MIGLSVYGGAGQSSSSFQSLVQTLAQSPNAESLLPPPPFSILASRPSNERISWKGIDNTEN